MVTFCSLAARSISSNRLKSLLLPAGPSGPSPTARSSASMRTTGATPLASFILLDGQCATPTPRAFRIAISASSTQTPCAATVRPLKTPSESSTLVGVMCRCASASSFSFLVSERWMISGALYLLASAREAFSVSSELV